MSPSPRWTDLMMSNAIQFPRLKTCTSSLTTSLHQPQACIFGQSMRNFHYLNLSVHPESTHPPLSILPAAYSGPGPIFTLLTATHRRGRVNSSQINNWAGERDHLAKRQLARRGKKDTCMWEQIKCSRKVQGWYESTPNSSTQKPPLSTFPRPRCEKIEGWTDAEMGSVRWNYFFQWDHPIYSWKKTNSKGLIVYESIHMKCAEWANP